MAERRNVFLLFRRAHDLTQAELARFMGTQQQSVQTWEKDPHRAPQWARLVCENTLLPPEDLERGLLIMRDKTEDYCKVMVRF